MAERPERRHDDPGKSARGPVPEPGDDFFCLRFGVWYPSFDCAIRTKYDTCPGCRKCDQGRFNLRRHSRTLAEIRVLEGPGAAALKRGGA